MRNNQHHGQGNQKSIFTLPRRPRLYLVSRILYWQSSWRRWCHFFLLLAGSRVNCSPTRFCLGWKFGRQGWFGRSWRLWRWWTTRSSGRWFPETRSACHWLKRVISYHSGSNSPPGPYFDFMHSRYPSSLKFESRQRSFISITR